MRRFARGVILIGLLSGVLGALPSSAAGSGLPEKGVTDADDASLVVPDSTTNRIAPPGGEGRFTVQLRDEQTQLTRVSPGGEHRSTIVAGRFAIPVVALDETPGGLSADGSTLALVRLREQVPQARTHLQIFDTRTLAREPLTLRGDFSFDAISPDGSALYFIHYLSPRDPTDYEVRAYDMDAGRLVTTPIVDASEPNEEMSGYPLTRMESPDGRWAYTLYDGGGETPFVHALDTTTGTAHCIDLDGVRARALGMTSNGDEDLTITQRGKPIREIDTSTFEVGPPGSASESGSSSSSDTGFLAPLLAGLAVAAGVALLGAFLLHRRRPASA